MIISKENLKNIHVPGFQMPHKSLFDLPEKVLQFGTGVLLRGLPDYYIDKANRAGIFNGRIVMVKSTEKGTVDEYNKQDCLYTIYSKGIENEKEISEKVICSSISRALSAITEWDAILEVAKSPDLQVVISNTTEVGISLFKESIHNNPPTSYPGKLLAVLYERYKSFNGSSESGLVIIPTELIVNNGKKLKAIVVELANYNNFSADFINWLENHNSFCDSLVDRIVPGKPEKEMAEKMEVERGYTDDLHIISETYGLWAIEGDERIAEVLSFSRIDSGIIITPDIELFRELKLRLLNGSHTLSCGLAIISGFDTVKAAMDDKIFFQFITGLVYDEIIQSIPYKVSADLATEFAGKMLDRFRNPYIRHEWMSISVQYSTKMKMRVLPLLLNYFKINNSVPPNIALGFAAFIRFMKITKNTDGIYSGLINGKPYTVNDSQASYFQQAWQSGNVQHAVKTILSSHTLWDTDLSALPGLEEAIISDLDKITRNV